MTNSINVPKSVHAAHAPCLVRSVTSPSNLTSHPLYASNCPLQVLETSPSLFFHLQQQRLIELIREGQAEAALDFAQEYLAPLAEDQAAFLEEMGKDFLELL